MNWLNNKTQAMRIFLASWICLMSASVFAQQDAVSTKRVLTFQEAIKIALKNSVNLNQQRNNLQLNQTQKISSIASLAPSISASTSASVFDGNSFNQNA
ncbi:MAG: hypothetical protein ACOVMQ_08400, partial [Cyclobacteriaceae bacterium]